MAQTVKHLPAMWETRVRSLGQEDPLEKEMATHSNTCLENSTAGGAWWATVHGVTKSRTRLSDFTFVFLSKGRPKYILGFPDSSVGKESTCNPGDPGSIPGSGRSAGEGIGYPLQYSWASLMAQLVKNPPAMWETWVQLLGWKEPL